MRCSSYHCILKTTCNSLKVRNKGRENAPAAVGVSVCVRQLGGPEIFSIEALGITSIPASAGSSPNF